MKNNPVPEIERQVFYQDSYSISVGSIDDLGYEHLKTSQNGFTTSSGIPPIKMWLGFDFESDFFVINDTKIQYISQDFDDLA